MQDLPRKRPDVISTRVGYTGGDVPNATYRHHGTHAEAIEIVFDPVLYDLGDFVDDCRFDPRLRNELGIEVAHDHRRLIANFST